MAYKTRLNRNMREYLSRLAMQRVKAPVEEAKYEQTYKDAEKEVLRCYKKQYPIRDMAVLTKYRLTMPTRYFQVIVMGSDTARFDKFELVGSKWDDQRKQPVMPANSYRDHRLNLDIEASRAWNAYETAKAAREAARKALLDEFQKVIMHAKSLEEIEAVWPLAKQARALVPQLPVVILSDAFENIRKAVEAKLA
jgi:3-deoxy-D-manno-octulosonic-acid transferase